MFGYNHRVWEGGRRKEEERDLDSLPGDTFIASVLSSLSLSLFTVIQVLTSPVPFCMEIWGLMTGRKSVLLKVIGV